MGGMIANTPAITPRNTGYIGKKNRPQKTFDCIFCEIEKCVDVTIKKKEKHGYLKCRKCHEGFRCDTIHLDTEVDVYANWIDACEEAASREIAQAREEIKEKLETVEEQKDACTKVLKPLINRRKLEDEAPVLSTKRSKVNDIQTEKRVATTDQTKTPSTQPGPAKQQDISLANHDTQSKKDLVTAIELNRKGKEATAKAEAQKKAALAKERRERKAKERARLEE